MLQKNKFYELGSELLDFVWQSRPAERNATIFINQICSRCTSSVYNYLFSKLNVTVSSVVIYITQI